MDAKPETIWDDDDDDSDIQSVWSSSSEFGSKDGENGLEAQNMEEKGKDVNSNFDHSIHDKLSSNEVGSGNVSRDVVPESGIDKKLEDEPPLPHFPMAKVTEGFQSRNAALMWRVPAEMLTPNQLLLLWAPHVSSLHVSDKASSPKFASQEKENSGHRHFIEDSQLNQIGKVETNSLLHGGNLQGILSMRLIKELARLKGSRNHHTSKKEVVNREGPSSKDIGKTKIRVSRSSNSLRSTSLLMGSSKDPHFLREVGSQSGFVWPKSDKVEEGEAHNGQ
ncbi:hypothetical protein L6452_04911 [Arctium lappa]|uniref:Uncharacterized protein n=1 Tax=Arctium lappa TaxID=4217 RepID=A0ACB9EEI7_ARCLA|nr:hypothetical protein L6452_04911 [Arctium lappa]